MLCLISPMPRLINFGKFFFHRHQHLVRTDRNSNKYIDGLLLVTIFFDYVVVRYCKQLTSFLFIQCLNHHFFCKKIQLIQTISDALHQTLVTSWCSGYHYRTTSINRALTQILCRFKSCMKRVRV